MLNHTDFFGIFLTIIMGLGWGSFSTMAVYRIPRGMPWIGDRPRCFLCKHDLNIIDYFSILSYFVWRGTCRYCKGKYECNGYYFLTELFITAGFVLCYMKYGFGDMFVLLTLLVVACTMIIIIDSEYKKIPAKILISTLLIGAVYRTFLDQTFYGGLYGGIAAGIAGLALRHIYFILKGQGRVGRDYTTWQMGDRFAGPGFDYVKMLAVTGVFLPFLPFAAFIIVAGSICLIWYIIQAGTLRPGAIMAVVLAVFIIYPEITQVILGTFFRL